MPLNENNCSMKLILDKIILYLTVLLLSLSWIWYLGIEMSIALPISIILSVMVCMVVYKNSSKISLSRYISYLRSLDDEALYNHISQYINATYEPMVYASHISLNSSRVLVAQLNYGGISKDYIAGLAKRYREATHIYLFTPHDTKGLLGYSHIPITPLHPKSLIHKLSKEGFSLPKDPKKRIDISMIFSRDRAKYYLLSGGILMLNIFLYTPYRLYYIIVSSILLGMAICCLFVKPNPKNSKLFE